MAKDYKHSPKPKDKPRKRAMGLPGWAGFVIGALVALVILKGAPVVWGKLQRRLHPAAAQSAKSPAKPAAQAGSASSSAATPHFDFYKLLPSFQVVIPSQDKETRSGDVPGPVSQPGTYILQVGSFQSYAEADRLKANLALLGVESSIQQVKVSNGAVWNRVRIGPIQSLNQLNALRAKLAQNHIEPLVIKTN
ncbi:MAG: SPOR domain-containing protein [Gammaproteobacteria bacterium]|nr:SPOR domain-containing protein [Gammaproteobacteria bacterium]MDE2346085.1 SPOR domain-containing protein [Gammaproteobacteria bacterium]